MATVKVEMSRAEIEQLREHPLFPVVESWLRPEEREGSFLSVYADAMMPLELMFSGTKESVTGFQLATLHYWFLVLLLNIMLFVAGMPSLSRDEMIGFSVLFRKDAAIRELRKREWRQKME